MSVMALLNKNAGSVKGYNYTKPGHDTPVNLLNLSPEERKEALKWYDEHSHSGSVLYLKKRIRLEKALRKAALARLGGDIVEHPLYFQVGKDPKGGFKGKNQVRELSRKLLESSTFYPGDSFDALRSEKDNKTTLARELKKIMTLEELEGKKKGMIELMGRKKGNYVEGQLWTPFKVLKNRLTRV